MKPRVPPQLRQARELIEVRLLLCALDALLVSLRIEHPTLESITEPTGPPTLIAARRLLRSLRQLRAALRAYRETVHWSLVERAHSCVDDAPAYDDIPF